MTSAPAATGSGAIAHPDPARRTGWDARLSLSFERIESRTMLARREHHGPLIVQKALYPEGADVCQCVIVHPPAGIVDGDRLALDVTVGREALVQLTTPGATKWYRATGSGAHQTLRARVDDAAVLEWLPQGTIVYDGARARNATAIDLASTATFVGIDVVSLGRRAAGERFRCGEWHQRWDILRDGAPMWSERAVLAGDSGMLASPVGLNGASVFGTLVAVGPRLDHAMMPALRGIADAQRDVVTTRLPNAIVARYLGDSMEAATAGLVALWTVLRPALIGRAARAPRIWST